MSAPEPTASTLMRWDLGVAPGNAQEFELWRWGVSPMFAMDARSKSARGAFRLQATSFQFADIAVASATSSATRFTRDTSVIARSGIDNIMVMTYVTGGFAFTTDGRDIQVRAGDVCVLDMTRRAELVTSHYRHLAVVLPRAQIEAVLPALDNLHGLVLPRGSPLNALLLSHMRALYNEAPALGLVEGRAAASATANLVAALVAPDAEAREISQPAVAAAYLQSLRRVIEANLDNPKLGPDMLLRQVGVSRSTLYRLFEPVGGIRSYIQQRRLTRAFQKISDPKSAHEKIGAIARRYGFTNDSVFSRSFRDAFGMSPSDMRQLAKTGYEKAATSQRSGYGAFWTLNRWLLGIDPSGR